MTISSAIILLLLVMDPLGNVPLFLAVLQHVPENRRLRIIVRELLIALAVMLSFMLLGRRILDAFQISEVSLQIAGGIVLFMIAIKMVFGSPSEQLVGYSPSQEPLVIPLAIPSVAGPSAIATVLILVTQHPGRLMEWLAALLAAWAISAGLLLSAGRLARVLGARGLLAMERLMGMLLTTLAAEMFLKGLAMFMKLSRG